MEFAAHFVLFIVCLFISSNDDFEYWSRVIFVDEKSFRSDATGQMHCWRPRATRYEARHLNLVQRSGHVSANMFGWMWAFGVGELTEINGRLNGELRLSVDEILGKKYYLN